MASPDLHGPTRGACCKHCGGCEARNHSRAEGRLEQNCQRVESHPEQHQARQGKYEEAQLYLVG